MFRRWRRARLAAQAAAHAAAPSPRPTAADLRGEHLFELLNAKLSEFIGPGGTWALVRRTDADTDRIFHAMLTHQIAAELTRTLLDERDTRTELGARAARHVGRSRGRPRIRGGCRIAALDRIVGRTRGPRRLIAGLRRRRSKITPRFLYGRIERTLPPLS